MATTVQQIDAWRAAHSEHQRLEFKEAKSQFDNRKLYKYCVAFRLICVVVDKIKHKVRYAYPANP